MAVVAEYKFKNAIVRIHDDYIETDPKEREHILARAWAIIDNARLRRAEEEEAKRAEEEKAKRAEAAASDLTESEKDGEKHGGKRIKDRLT